MSTGSIVLRPLEFSGSPHELVMKRLLAGSVPATLSACARLELCGLGGFVIANVRLCGRCRWTTRCRELPRHRPCRCSECRRSMMIEAAVGEGGDGRAGLARPVVESGITGREAPEGDADVGAVAGVACAQQGIHVVGSRVILRSVRRRALRALRGRALRGGRAPSMSSRARSSSGSRQCWTDPLSRSRRRSRSWGSVGVLSGA